MVFIPHGEPLEPLYCIIEGLPELNAEFIKNCNLHRASVKGEFFVKLNYSVFHFACRDDLEKFTAFICENGVRIDA